MTPLKEDLWSQHQRALVLQRQQLDEEALEIVSWIWEHGPTHDPGWTRSRRTAITHFFEPLIKRSEEARKRFGELRDRAMEKDDEESFVDFLVLNKWLGETERTVAWLEAATPDQAERLRIHSKALIRELVETNDLWALLGRLLKNGVEVAERYHRFVQDSFADPPKGLTEEDHARARRITRESAASFARPLVRALRAANRIAEASELDAWADGVLASGK